MTQTTERATSINDSLNRLMAYAARLGAAGDADGADAHIGIARGVFGYASHGLTEEDRDYWQQVLFPPPSDTPVL